MTPHVIWCLVTGQWPAGLIDHINGDQTDNSWGNLREATPSENQYNKLYKGNYTSCVVEKKDAARKKPFAVRVRYDGHRYHLGHYATREEAEQVALKFKLDNHAEFSAELSRP